MGGKVYEGSIIVEFDSVGSWRSPVEFLPLLRCHGAKGEWSSTSAREVLV